MTKDRLLFYIYRFIIIGIIFLISLFLVNAFWPVYAYDISPLPSNDKILNSEIIDDIRCDNDFRCEIYGTIVKYDYISNKEIRKELLFLPGEDLSNIEILDNNKWKIYSGKPFIFKDNKVYQIETATTTIEKFIAHQNNLFLKLKYSFIALADSFFAGAGDGWTQHFSANDTWSNIRDGAGTDADWTTGNDLGIAMKTDSTSDKYRYLRRAIFSIDTSALPDDITINSATFYNYIYSKSDDNNWLPNLNVYSASPALFTELSAGDYDSLGIDAYSNFPIAYGDIVENYNSWAFNTTGLAGINKTGYTAIGLRNVNYDVNNIPPTWTNSLGYYFYIRFSEFAGTDSDPYLIIEWEEEPPPEEPVATTTIGFLYPDNMCLNNDLSIICGMTLHYISTSAPAWVEYHYFHIPFFVWVIIFVILLFVLNRFLIEFLIRFRKEN